MPIPRIPGRGSTFSREFPWGLGRAPWSAAPWARARGRKSGAPCRFTNALHRACVYISAPGPSGGMADATDSKSVGGNPMRVRLSPRALVLVGLLWAFNALLAVAQQPSFRGTVVSAETREPLGFSIVILHPTFGERFTDAAGAFAFEGTTGGSYLLR